MQLQVETTPDVTDQKQGCENKVYIQGNHAHSPRFLKVRKEIGNRDIRQTGKEI